MRASDGAIVARWVTPTAAITRGGGTWGAGAGLMSDGSGRIFLSTGNGFNAGEVPGNRPHAGDADPGTLASGRPGVLGGALAGPAQWDVGRG